MTGKSGKIARMSDAIVILCTCPDERAAEALGRGLLSARLVACVNVLPSVRSMYRWHNEIMDEQEVLLLIKTMNSRFEKVSAWLTAHHPYDVPEVVALPTRAVSAPYLEWLDASVSGPQVTEDRRDD